MAGVETARRIEGAGARRKGTLVHNPEVIAFSKASDAIEALDDPAAAARVVKHLVEIYVPRTEGA